MEQYGKTSCAHEPRCLLLAGTHVVVAGKEYSERKRRLCRTSDENVRGALQRYHKQSIRAADKLAPKRYKRWQRRYFALIAEANRRRSYAC